MAFSFKLPKFDLGKKPAPQAEAEMTVSSVMPSPIAILTPRRRGGSGSRGSNIPKIPLPKFLLDKPMEDQLKILGGIFVALLFATVVLVLNDNRKTTHGTAYLTAAGEMRMLSQRLSKASSLAVQGNPTAFAQLKDSQKRFSELLVRLTDGGEVAGTSVPKSPSVVTPQLSELTQLWEETNKNSEAMISQETPLVSLDRTSPPLMPRTPICSNSRSR